MATGKSSISWWAGRSKATHLAAEPPTVPCPPLELSAGHAVKNTWGPVSVGLPSPELQFPHL